MKNLFILLISFLYLNTFSQDDKTNDQSEVPELMDYRGGYVVNSIIEYDFIDGIWVIFKKDKGYLYYSGQKIYFKNNENNYWL